MSSALFFLISRSYANSVLVKLRRLREPKYLIALFVGILWLGMATMSLWLPRAGSRGPTMNPEGALLIGALVLSLALLVMGWLSPISKGALNFSENEAAWLFAAPLGRGALFGYHFLKPQWGIFILSIFVAIWWHAKSGAPHGPAIVTVWLLWNLFTLHNFAMAVVWRDLEQRPIITGLLKLLATVAFLAIVILMGRVGLEAYQPQASLASAPSLPMLERLVSPIMVLLRPIAAQDWPSLFQSIGPLLGLNLLCWWIIVSGKSPWVEVTLEAIVVREERLASMRSGRAWWRKPVVRTAQEELFPLPSHGPAWVGFLWKWGLHTGGKGKLTSRFQWVIVLLIMVIAGALAVDLTLFNKAHGDLIILGALLYLGVGLPGVFIIPAQITQRLRADLDHMDILFTLPTKPHQMLGGMLVGPLVQMVLIAWLVISTVAAVCLLRPTFPQITPGVVASGWFAACLTIAVLVPTVTFVHCWLVIVFPGWQPMQRKPGIDNMGLGMLAMLIIFAILALTVGVSALLCFLIYLAGGKHLPLPLQMVTSGVVAAIIISVEGWIAFKLACHQLWRYDPSEKTAGVRKSRS
jgi:ABC-2 type transport system permease protein